MGKNYDKMESDKLKLFQSGFRAAIADMLCVRAWARVLTLTLSVFISMISPCLLRAFV